MRRVIFYLFFDPEGIVDEFVLHKLRALRDHAEHIFVVSNGPILPDHHERLQKVADTVWTRENVGFDVWAYKESLERFGRERLKEYDELILMNYTFFGPVGSFSPVFARMDADQDIDFWGISDHEATIHPAAPDHPLPQHIQSHWIAVRRAMFTSPAWRRYWRTMPMTSSYVASITRHEGRFTDYFKRAGFRARVAFAVEDYPSGHPIAENTLELLEDGCPIVKRRSFFSDPLYLDRRSIDSRAVADEMERRGFPLEMALANLARTSEPRVLLTNLALLEILPDEAPEQSASARVVALAHADDASGIARIARRLGHLPEHTHVVLTVPDEETKEAANDLLATTSLSGEVRVLPSTRGGYISALLVGCRDILESADYDLIVRLRSIPQEGRQAAADAEWERQLHENVLASPGYFRNVLGLFARHSSLGMVFPPVVHMSRPTLGHGWAGARKDAQELAAKLGIDVPFDKNTPLAPFGGMFVARPEALRPLLAANWDYADFPETEPDDQPDHKPLHVVVERLLAYSALSQGLHVREIAHPTRAALAYNQLEFKYQLLAAQLGRRPDHQMRRIGKLKSIEALVKASERR